MSAASWIINLVRVSRSPYAFKRSEADNVVRGVKAEDVIGIAHQLNTVADHVEVFRLDRRLIDANASDVDSPSLSAVNLQIASGQGTLVNNGDGSWSYTPAANDDTGVTFSYSVTDGSLSARHSGPGRARPRRAR